MVVGNSLLVELFCWQYAHSVATPHLILLTKVVGVRETNDYYFEIRRKSRRSPAHRNAIDRRGALLTVTSAIIVKGGPFVRKRLPFGLPCSWSVLT